MLVLQLSLIKYTGYESLEKFINVLGSFHAIMVSSWPYKNKTLDSSLDSECLMPNSIGYEYIQYLNIFSQTLYIITQHLSSDSIYSIWTSFLRLCIHYLV